MKKAEFLAKVAEMLPDLQKIVMERAVQVSEDKCYHLEDYPDNYHLPKIFMQAMGMEITRQYSGSKRDRVIANTIYHSLR